MQPQFCVNVRVMLLRVRSAVGCGNTWLKETGTNLRETLPPTTLKVKTMASRPILPRCAQLLMGCDSSQGVAVQALAQRQQHTMCQKVRKTGCRNP